MVDLPRRAVLAALALLPVAGCTSPLGTFDAVVPKDGGGRRAARGVAYGAGARRTLDVYVPERTGGPFPVVVFAYGGSWSSGAKEEYDFVGRAFASDGFVTVVFDYRLVPEVVFPGFVEDAAAAVAWTRREIGAYGGDPDRIVLAGHSAGAYIVAMLGLDRSFLAAAGVPRRAVRGVIGLAGPYDFLPLDVSASQRAFGDAPDLAATQPVNQVTRAAPPFLLATGTDDTTVRPRNSEALADRLKSAGVPATYTRYPGLGHVDILIALSRYGRDDAPVLADAAAFARRVTGG